MAAPAKGCRYICQAVEDLRRYNMTDKEKIAQLKDLIRDRKTFLTGEPEEDEIFLNDIEALEWAIGKLE